MQTKIKVISKIESNVFGYKFKGIYLSSESKKIVGTSEVLDKIPSTNLSFGNSVTLDAQPISNILEVGKEYDVNCLFLLYANNPAMGVVLTITKLLN